MLSRSRRAVTSPTSPPSAAEDLVESDLTTLKTVCVEVFASPPSAGFLYGELARRIRVDLDKRMNHRGWSCVVGRSFGAHITQKIRCYAYLSVFPGINILCWKA